MSAPHHVDLPARDREFTGLDIPSLAETIHEYSGATGDLLTQETMIAASALGYALVGKECGDYFASRAREYGPILAMPLVRPAGPEPADVQLVRHKAVFGD